MFWKIIILNKLFFLFMASNYLTDEKLKLKKYIKSNTFALPDFYSN